MRHILRGNKKKDVIATIWRWHTLVESELTEASAFQNGLEKKNSILLSV